MAPTSTPTPIPGRPRVVLIVLARAAGLVALGLGAAWWFGTAIPLHAHMGAGGLYILLLWGLAVLAWRVGRRGSALVALLLGLALPLVGLAQIYAVEARAAVQVVLAVTALGWADRLSALLKKAGRTDGGGSAVG